MSYSFGEGCDKFCYRSVQAFYNFQDALQWHHVSSRLVPYGSPKPTLLRYHRKSVGSFLDPSAEASDVIQKGAEQNKKCVYSAVSSSFPQAAQRVFRHAGKYLGTAGNITSSRISIANSPRGYLRVYHEAPKNIPWLAPSTCARPPKRFAS